MSDSSFAADGLAADFRTAMRGLAATVTVISTQHRDVRHGIVATAVMSVSLEPPSLAICINRGASIHEPLSQHLSFAVNVLSKRHEAISQRFARSRADERFRHGRWRDYAGADPGFLGIPFLEDAQAVLFCKVKERLDFGTHTLFVAIVEEISRKPEPAPLVYCQGSYGSFAEIAG